MLSSIFGLKMENKFIKKHPTLFTIWTIASFAAMFLGIYSVNYGDPVIRPIMRGIVCLLAGVSVVLLNFVIDKKLDNTCKTLLILFPVVLFACLLFFPRRVDYIIYNAYSLATTIYFVYGLFRKLIKKDGDALVSGLLPIVYSAGLMITKVLEMDRFIKTFTEDLSNVLMLIALIACVASIVLYLCFVRNKDSKKSYIKNIFLTAVCVFLLVFGLPLLTAENLNYAFDSSEGVIVEYQIVDKGYSHGGYRSPGSYHVVILHNGEEVKIKLTEDEYIYYRVGEYITLTKHEGALGLTYLEYYIDY